MIPSGSYQRIAFTSDEYVFCDLGAFVDMAKSGETENEERMINIISHSKGLAESARLLIDIAGDGYINEWFVEIDCASDVEDKNLKFLASSPDLQRVVRFVADVATIDSKALERCSLVQRLLLQGDGGDPFKKEWDSIREKWIQYLLWCGDKINISYTDESFMFLRPDIVSRIAKPAGGKPRTFIVYSGI